jgi:hypothetical protein
MLNYYGGKTKKSGYKKKRAGVKSVNNKPTTSKKTVVNKTIKKSVKKTVKKKSKPQPPTSEELDVFFNNIIAKKNLNIQDKDALRKNIFEGYTIPYARNLMTNFVTLLRHEGNNPYIKNKSYNNVATKIGEDCLKNFDINDPICFCCGKKIEVDSNNKPKNVACDHVIPIISMLLLVEPKSISKNLHYIHDKCNGIKKDKHIYQTYLDISNNAFNSKKEPIPEELTKAKEKFLNILKNLEFRKASEINRRVALVPEFQKTITDFKNQINFFLNDEVEAAMTLMKMKKKN